MMGLPGDKGRLLGIKPSVLGRAACMVLIASQVDGTTNVWRARPSLSCHPSGGLIVGDATGHPMP